MPCHMFYAHFYRSQVYYLSSCDGRVVKAFDLKSNGIFPRRFESYSQRNFFLLKCNDLRALETSKNERKY